MVQASVEHDTSSLPSAGSLEAGMKWSAIFASLTELEHGLRKAEADLDHLRADLKAFRKSLDAPSEEGTRP